jgi:hypothetical protein
MLTSFTAKNGSPTLRYEKKFIYSSYNPEREISQFLEQQDLSSDSHVIVFGDYLGYMQRQLENKVQSIHSIVFQATIYNAAESYCISTENDWGLFNELITDQNVSRIKLLVWQPGFVLNKKFAKGTLSFVFEHIKRCQKSLLSSRYFGSRWIKNWLKTIIIEDDIEILEKIEVSHVIVAASGPSLDQSFEAIKSYISMGYALISLPSAVQALHAAGIFPDLIIQTDGGFYNRYHLREHQRGDLIALFESGIRSSLYALSDFFLSKYIFKGFNQFSMRSTVLSTALSMIKTDILESCLIFGADFSYFDIQSHCRNHSFMPLLSSLSNRCLPLEQIFADRNLFNESYVRKNVFVREYEAGTIYRDEVLQLIAHDPRYAVFSKSFSSEYFPHIFSDHGKQMIEKKFRKDVRIFSLKERLHRLELFKQKIDTDHSIEKELDRYVLKKDKQRFGSASDFLKELVHDSLELHSVHPRESRYGIL